MKQIVWKPVPGYEEEYEAADIGLIRSRPRNGTTSEFHILRPEKTRQGRLQVTLSKGNARTRFRIHQLIAITFIPNPELKPEINHKDGNPLNNNVENLEWCTKSENAKHAIKRKLRNTGEKHSQAKLKNSQVLQIKLIYQQGKNMLSDYRDNYSQVALAKRFGVTQATISAIVLGKTRKYD